MQVCSFNLVSALVLEGYVREALAKSTPFFDGLRAVSG